MSYSNRTSSCGCNNESLRNNESRNGCGCGSSNVEPRRSCGCNNGSSRNNESRNGCGCGCSNIEPRRSSCACNGPRGTDLIAASSQNRSSCSCCKCKEKCNCRVVNTNRGKLIYFFDDVKR